MKTKSKKEPVEVYLGDDLYIEPDFENELEIYMYTPDGVGRIPLIGLSAIVEKALLRYLQGRAK